MSDKTAKPCPDPWCRGTDRDCGRTPQQHLEDGLTIEQFMASGPARDAHPAPISVLARAASVLTGGMSEQEIEQFIRDREGTATNPDRADRVDAPWTAAQVDSLRRYQRESMFHPFTCPNRRDGRHERTRDLGVLEVTPAAWICPDCDYVQTWAHAWMADFAWMVYEQQALAALVHEGERLDGGPAADVEIDLPGGGKWAGELRGADTVTIVINGRPAFGVNAEGTVGHWPDGETWVPLVT